MHYEKIAKEVLDYVLLIQDPENKTSEELKEEMLEEIEFIISTS